VFGWLAASGAKGFAPAGHRFTVGAVPSSQPERAAKLRELFVEHYRHVLAYAIRRTDRPGDADDVAAETFAVAWRRIGQAPAEEFELAWLYAIAGRVLANQRRSQRRLTALRSRLRAVVPAAPPRDEAESRAEAQEVLAAIVELKPQEREILRLVAWEGLTNAELGVALGCSENAAAIRLHRSRKRLAEQLAKGIEPAGHSVVGGAE
jgi:RNA polymerase sigma-70 factor (ECF subfamily)